MDFNQILKLILEYDANLPPDRQGSNDPGETDDISDEEWEDMQRTEVDNRCECSGGDSLKASDHDDDCPAKAYIIKKKI
jgi:hypothetical protein